MNMQDTWIAVLATAALALGGQVAPGEDVTIAARDLSASSRNVFPTYDQFGGLTLAEGQGGFAEWTFALKSPYSDVSRGYLHVLYASGQHRGCRLTVNGHVHPPEILAETTGGFHPVHLEWTTLGPFDFRKGKNTIRVDAPGHMPHLKGLYVSSEKAPPEKSVFRDPEAESAALVEQINLKALRPAIEYLSKQYGDEYPRAESFLASLAAIELKLASVLKEKTDTLQRLSSLTKRAEQLRRDALITENPLMRFEKLLLVKRNTFQSSHYYTDFIDGCKHFGGSLCVLSLSNGQITDLAPSMKQGIFGRYDLSWDSEEIVFGHKSGVGKGFRIYAVGSDGKGLRPITVDPPNEQARIEKYWLRDVYRDGSYKHQTDDMHPCWLPGGDICFTSTRCERGILCDGPDRLTTAVLYRAAGDGSTMRELSHSQLSEFTPLVMDDGRILYNRWEYIDKGAVTAKGLWAIRPDGSGGTEVFGNQVTYPCTFIAARPIPGRDGCFVAVGAPHMPLGVGTIVRIDTHFPIRTRQPMTYITPNVDIRAEYGFFHQRQGRWVREETGPLFADPFPLSDKFFLVSCNPDRPWNAVDAYGIYLIDDFGNRTLVYRDPSISCWQPIPLMARPTPPQLSAVAENTDLPAEGGGEATLVMSDVYQGMKGIPRGTVKHLRIMEDLPRPWSARRFWDGDAFQQQHAAVGMNGHLGARVVHGVVPVYEDGSASFVVPANRNIYFQALDENFMEVQRMRTFINLMSGERRSCIGCHEHEGRAPPNQSLLALTRPPTELTAQMGDTIPRPVHYPTYIQPILDGHCVTCHADDRIEGDLDLSGELTTLFNRSYENIVRRNLVQKIDELGPKTGNTPYVPPLTLGSHRSKLIDVLREGHYDVQLPQADFVKLVTWIDANSPYYGTYFGRRNLKYRDHPDFRPQPDALTQAGREKVSHQ
ncbi:MAG: hypothetical protein GY903_15080 [Fuerstiella sp.]|nr:hypothetical protein [Fuerstiella sp.]MCP4855806.1 hypothetical protein [Fuerstiella sp.]